jgi:solute carrier family 8 (sodium/calcium exchanger)
MIVNIVTDVEEKKKHEALEQLLKKIEAEEEQTWGQQFIVACCLHPTKNEDGEINDIDGVEGFLHFITIGWKIFFALIPPAHIGDGWPCFILSLVFIGIVTYVVGEFANLFGCVLNIKPSVTAITFVALGTSLPDTFASMAAAVQEKYADSAIGNVTGSNSVNVFLGLGLPWVIATIWESMSDLPEGDPNYKGYTSGGSYYVPGGTLGFSVIVFCVCALIALAFLRIRRTVVGGELGGSANGRMLSMLLLVALWIVYITMSILQSENVGGLNEPNADGSSWGIHKPDWSKVHPKCKRGD